ncbi:MAG: HRDC domain-containing protein [Bacilli bacterium]|nr:HRDC domain-containing protein [Bacilli bacterium]
MRALILSKISQIRTKAPFELKVLAYYVFTNEELDKLVELVSKSIEELKKLNILIPIKIKVHGECVVDKIIK